MTNSQNFDNFITYPSERSFLDVATSGINEVSDGTMTKDDVAYTLINCLSSDAIFLTDHPYIEIISMAQEVLSGSEIAWDDLVAEIDLLTKD